MKWNEQIIIIPVNSIYSPLLGKENFGNFNNNIAQCCTMYYCILYISTIKHNGKTTAIFTHALLSNTSPNLIPRLLDHTAPRPPSPITPSPWLIPLPALAVSWVLTKDIVVFYIYITYKTSILLVFKSTLVCTSFLILKREQPRNVTLELLYIPALIYSYFILLRFLP